MTQRSQALLWNGFGFDWNKNPHRLSILGSRFEETLLEANRISAWHRFRSRIGNWPQDSLRYAVPFTFLQAEEVWLGTTTVRCQVRAIYKQKGRTAFAAVIPLNSIKASLPFSQIKDPATANWMAFLNGFHIFPANNPSGWHFKGLGMNIGKPSVVADQISIPITVDIFPAKSLDPFNHGNEDWSSMPECIYNLEIDLFILADPRSRVKAIPFASKGIKGGKGEDGLQEAFQYQTKEAIEFFSAIHGFHYQDIDLKSNGKYIRGLKIKSERYHEDRDKGLYISNCDLSFSNRGKWPFLWEMEMNIQTSMVTFPSDLLQIKTGTLEGETSMGEKMHEQVLRFNFD